MEKYNETDLMKEIKNCTYEQDYETAVQLAEKLDLNKMKNVSSLCLLGEIFLHEGENELAEKVLLKAYERMPRGRRALDMLTSLYIDKGSYSEAEYYYKEFISVASRDLHRYILRYRLDKGKGERTSVLIHTLEQLKDYEYIEEWAYELAKLYAEAGETKKCLRECDEIALWFGTGEYVDMANALKEEVNAKMAAEAEAAAMHQTVGATYMFDSEGLLERSDFNVPLNVDAYMSDDEYSDVYDLEEGGKTEKVAIPDSEELLKADLSEKLSDVHEDEADEKDADEETLFETESIRSSAVMMENVEDDEEDEVMDSNVIAAKAASILSGDGFDSEEDDEEDFIARLQKKIESNRSGVTPIVREDIESRMRMVQPESISVLDEADEEEDDETDDIIISDIDHTAMNMFFGELDFSEKSEPLITLDDDDDGDDETSDEMDTDDFEEISKKMEESSFEETIEEVSEDSVVENVSEKLDVSEQKAIVEEKQENVTVQSSFAEDEDETLTEDIPVPDTVLDIFATAVDIRNVKKQLAETFTKLESSLLEKEDILAPYDINFVVSGSDESMKSQISIGIAKALNTYGMCDKTKMVRATADELNRMDFSVVFEKIAGGCLIISGAGALSDESIEIVSEYVNRDEQKVAIVLEDSESYLMDLWKRHPKLRSKFLNVINISKYDESELVKLAESYAKRRGYDISDEVRNVVLRELFANRMSGGEDVNYEDVMAVVDEAVVNLEKRNMKNLFMTVLDNAYSEASMFTLIPEDFN